jgi:hypothetical protein
VAVQHASGECRGSARPSRYGDEVRRREDEFAEAFGDIAPVRFAVVAWRLAVTGQPAYVRRHARIESATCLRSPWDGSLTCAVQIISRWPAELTWSRQWGRDRGWRDWPQLFGRYVARPRRACPRRTPEGGRADQPTVQGAPLRVNAVGGRFADRRVPYMPVVVLAPGARVPFQLTFVIVTDAPTCENEEFHEFVIFWSAPNAKASFHPLMAADPVLVMVTSATKPSGHSDVFLYTTRHAGRGGVPADGLTGGGVGAFTVIVPLDSDTLPAASRART